MAEGGRVAGVLGFGGYAPERIMTNDDWAALVDTDDEWITTRTGIKRRHFAAEDESTLDLAHASALVAIDDAGLTAADLEESQSAQAWAEIEKEHLDKIRRTMTLIRR